MHHIHQTNSQMYDYIGEENYRADYFMIDLDIGPKLNFIAGLEMKPMKQPYYSMNSLDHALSHWIFVGDTTKYKRKKLELFCAFS